MKVNKVMKGLAVVACLSAMVVQTAPMTAQANVSEQVQPMMVYISSYNVSLSISNTGKASVSAFVMSNNASNYVKATLQKKSGSDWEDIKSWEASGQGYAGISETYSVSKGTYRVVATFKANTETAYKTSASKTY